MFLDVQIFWIIMEIRMLALPIDLLLNTCVCIGNLVSNPLRVNILNGQSLYNAMLRIHRTGPCYKWTVL